MELNVKAPAIDIIIIKKIHSWSIKILSNLKLSVPSCKLFRQRPQLSFQLKS